MCLVTVPPIFSASLGAVYVAILFSKLAYTQLFLFRKRGV